MTEFYNDSKCGRCIRSSPLASLWGLLLVIIGGGCFAGGALFLRRSIRELVGLDYTLPYFDYLIYAIIGVLALFSCLAYLVNAISSGWNGKHFFESSQRIAFARALLMLFMIFHVLGILIWMCASLLSACLVLSQIFLLIKVQLNSTANFDLSYYGVYDFASSQGVVISAAKYNSKYQQPLICSSILLAGCVMIVFGHIQLAMCAAMNYARLEESRFFSSTNNDFDAETRSL